MTQVFLALALLFKWIVIALWLNVWAVSVLQLKTVLILSSDAVRFEGFPSALSRFAWHRPKWKNGIYFWAEFLVKSGKDGGTADDDTNGDFGVGPETHEAQVVCHILRQTKFPRVVGTHDGCNTGSGRALIVSDPLVHRRPFQRLAWGHNAYRKPAAKIVQIPILLFRGSCNFQTDLIGRTKIAKSVITLNTPVDLKVARISKQCPCCIKGFQSFSRGVHMKITKRVWRR